MHGTADRARRSSPRLEEYDYAQENYYFVTTCIRGGTNLFGTITNGEMMPNAWGHQVSACWNDLPRYFQHMHMDSFVLMPNHIHGIVSIHGDAPRENRPTLSAIVGAFKSLSTRQINAQRETPGQSIWQRSFYDHIIRNDADLERIRDYIAHNPERWEQDRFYS